MHINTEINHEYWEIVEIQTTIPRVCYAKETQLKAFVRKERHAHNTLPMDALYLSEYLHKENEEAFQWTRYIFILWTDKITLANAMKMARKVDDKLI